MEPMSVTIETSRGRKTFTEQEITDLGRRIGEAEQKRVKGDPDMMPRRWADWLNE